MSITLETFTNFASKAKNQEQFVTSLNLYLPQAQITTPVRLPMFMAQMHHESMGFTHLHEIWGPTEWQKKYEFNKNLGNTQAGDGRRFSGRGIIQLTGRFNYEVFGKKIGIDLISDPERAADIDTACRIAVEYWLDRGLNAVCDIFRQPLLIQRVTQKINGPKMLGLAERNKLFIKAMEIFK